MRLYGGSFWRTYTASRVGSKAGLGKQCIRINILIDRFMAFSFTERLFKHPDLDIHSSQRFAGDHRGQHSQRSWLVWYTQLSLSMFWGIRWNAFKVPAKEQQKNSPMIDIYSALFFLPPHLLCGFSSLNFSTAWCSYHKTLLRSPICHFIDNLLKWHDRKVWFFCFIL